MKHSRNEIIKYNVGSYLKNRHYSDNENFRKSDLNLYKTTSQMALSCAVENEASMMNSIIYSCINNDPAVAEAQFCKLENWINDFHSKMIGNELKGILFPLVCHLYIEMLRGGHKAAASTFLKRHQSVGTGEEAISVLEELASVENLKEIEEKNMIHLLRSSRYQLMLSPQSLEILKQYLIRNSHIILLQIINCWFELEETSYLDENFPESSDPDYKPVSLCNGYSEHTQQSDSDLAKLEEIIRLVNEGPSSPSPLLLYSVHNAENTLTCGKVSCNTKLLAAGFTTSEIKVWSLTENKLYYNETVTKMSRSIKLAVDIDEDDDQDDNHLSPSDSVTMKGHCECVQDVAFVPGCDILVSVSMDKTMRAWDLNSYTCKAIYRGHHYPIWTLDVSTLGLYIATGSHDRTARLWSLERNYPLRIFAGHTQDVDSLKFHPNGSYLATGSSDKSIRLWSISSGDLVRVLPGHRGCIYCLTFSPDGKYLASSGEDKRIKIWDLTAGALLTELKGHSETVTGLDWSPDGEFISSCSLDNTARIWSLRNAFGAEELNPQQTPKIYTISCNSLVSIAYSRQNTPICIGGV